MLDVDFLAFGLAVSVVLVFNTGVLEQDCWQEPDIKLEMQEAIAAPEQHRS